MKILLAHARSNESGQIISLAVHIQLQHYRKYFKQNPYKPSKMLSFLS